MMRLLFRQLVARRAAGFYFARPGNLLLVHGTGEGGVSIHATTDNLGPDQQKAFVGYLCAEGFLSGEPEPLDCFQQNRMDGEEQPVRWMVDPSWPEADAAFALHVRRLCWCMTGTLMVWLALMTALVCC